MPGFKVPPSSSQHLWASNPNKPCLWERLNSKPRFRPEFSKWPYSFGACAPGTGLAELARVTKASLLVVARMWGFDTDVPGSIPAGHLFVCVQLLLVMGQTVNPFTSLSSAGQLMQVTARQCEQRIYKLAALCLVHFFISGLGSCWRVAENEELRA